MDTPSRAEKIEQIINEEDVIKKAVLFVSPPSTGKTTLAQYLRDKYDRDNSKICYYLTFQNLTRQDYLVELKRIIQRTFNLLDADVHLLNIMDRVKLLSQSYVIIDEFDRPMQHYYTNKFKKELKSEEAFMVKEFYRTLLEDMCCNCRLVGFCLSNFGINIEKTLRRSMRIYTFHTDAELHGIFGITNHHVNNILHNVNSKDEIVEKLDHNYVYYKSQSSTYYTINGVMKVLMEYKLAYYREHSVMLIFVSVILFGNIFGRLVIRQM